jgi:uncharacterized HAD superfamily protein
MMAIGIDCDEVIFPLLPNHCIFLNKKHGINLDWNNFTTYNFWEHYNGTREQAVQDFVEFTSTDEFMRTMPIPGSQEGVGELRKLDELYLITSRTDKLRDKTQEWLDTHFPNLFSRLVFGNAFSNGEHKKTSKRQLCHENGVGLLLEDHYDYALDVSQDIPVLLFDRPWNRKYSSENPRNIIRVKSWNQSVAAAEYLYRRK